MIIPSLTNSASSSASSNHSSVAFDRQQLRIYVDGKIEQECGKFDPEKGNITKKIQDILRLKRKRDVEEFEIVDNGESEHDYKCPYSGMLLVEPMKK